MLMKILVTGATGFIRNHVVRGRVPKNNYNVIATSSNENKANAFPWFKDVEYKSFNLSKFEKQSQLL